MDSGQEGYRKLAGCPAYYAAPRIKGHEKGPKTHRENQREASAGPEDPLVGCYTATTFTGAFTHDNLLVDAKRLMPELQGL